MCQDQTTVSLGFTEQRFPPGAHICQIVSDDSERDEALQKYLLSGLSAGERTACFSEKVSQQALTEFLADHNLSYQQLAKSETLTLSPTRSVYFEDDRFDPDRMLAVLKQFYQDSVNRGYPAARVIGEMAPEVQRVFGGSRLAEYESRVSLLQREFPVTAVCQYDAREFDGSTIMDILKVHPYMIVRGAVVHNPFFISPEEYLDIH